MLVEIKLDKTMGTVLWHRKNSASDQIKAESHLWDSPAKQRHLMACSPAAGTLFLSLSPYIHNFFFIKK